MLNTSKAISPKSIILIVDKVGVFGERLAEKYSDDYLVVLVTNRYLKNNNARVSTLKHKGRVPRVPQNKYKKIFIIDDGLKSTFDYTTSFIKEARLYDSEFYYLASLRNPNLSKIGSKIKNYDKAKAFVFGDVFDNKIYFEKDSTVTRFVSSVRKNNKIVVANEGLASSYPISLEDTLKLIIKASHIRVSQKIILLFYSTPITDMSLAHVFQKLNPEIDVDFKKTKIIKKSFFPKDSMHAIRNYNVKKEIAKLDLSKNDERESLTIKNDEKKDRSPYWFIFSFLLIVLFVLLLPMITTKTYMAAGSYQLASSHKSIGESDYEKAFSKARSAESLYQFSQKSNDILETQLELISKENYNNNIELKIQDGIRTSKSIANFYEGLLKIQNVVEGESFDKENDFNLGIGLLKSSYSSYIEDDAGKNSSASNVLEKVFPSVERLASISDVLPELFGISGEKNYLLLVSDSSTLRPGGGKIEAIGVVNVSDFQIVDVKFMSPNAVRVNPEVNIETPYYIRRHTGIKTSSINEGGVDMDLVSNSIKLSNIYGLESEKEVDGVITIDTYYLKRLLVDAGTIDLDGYGEISNENLQDVLVEIDDKDLFYVDLLNAMKSKLNDENLNPYYIFLYSLKEMTDGKHLVFAFKNPEMQNVFTSSNLSGSLFEKRRDELGAMHDYFGIYESSVGPGGFSRFLSRSIDRVNTISSDGEFVVEASISFKNSIDSSRFKNSSYKNYIHLVLPLGSRIDEVSVGGKNQDLIPAITDPGVYESKQFVEPEELEIKQSVESGKSIFGFVIEVQPDSVSVVKVTYALPFQITEGEDGTKYSLQLFKQPGVKSYPFNMIFKSDSFVVLPSEPYNGEISRDEILEYRIIKK